MRRQERRRGKEEEREEGGGQGGREGRDMFYMRDTDLVTLGDRVVNLLNTLCS